MREDVRDAIEAAIDGVEERRGLATRRKRLSPEALRVYLHRVLSELPEDMSVRELREELDNAVQQGVG